MLELLYDARTRVLTLLEEWSHTFFETAIGQRILILLAPFVLLPGVRIEERQAFAKLFKLLHMQAWVPAIGGLFFSSALTVMFRTLQRAHVPLVGFIDIEAFNVFILLTTVNVFFGYIMALMKFITPYIINFFVTDEKLMTESLLFWATRYGGFLMFFGVVAWLITGLIVLKPSFLVVTLLLFGLLTLGYVIRKELSKQQERFIKTISPHLRLPFFLVESALFIFFSFIAAMSIWTVHSLK